MEIVLKYRILTELDHFGITYILTPMKFHIEKLKNIIFDRIQCVGLVRLRFDVQFYKDRPKTGLSITGGSFKTSRSDEKCPIFIWP